MPVAAPVAHTKAILAEVPRLVADAVNAAEQVYGEARKQVAALVTRDGRVSGSLVEEHQSAAHGLAWLATYVETLRQLALYAARLEEQEQLGETETLIVQIIAGEYLNQIIGGIPMNQGEFVRPHDLGLEDDALRPLMTGAAAILRRDGNTPGARARLIGLMVGQDGALSYGATNLDETVEQMRQEMRRFVEDKVAPHAHQWHLDNAYIPLDILAELSSLGVFALTLPEEYGGLGLGKEAMCVVSEELSRGYIGVGSLGTRTEIAAELIMHAGTEQQKQHFLPKLASGEILPTAVFTEPNTGSDLASLRTRAVREGDVYKVYGNKTWITHRCGRI